MKPLHIQYKVLVHAVSGLLLVGWGWNAHGEDGDAGSGYEGGRGLITLEGPSGLFINPTSATLPKNAYTAQYCVFFPDNRSDVVGHGALGSFGSTDDFEFGAIATFLDFKGDGGHAESVGPYATYRIRKDDGTLPQISAGGYSRLGDKPLTHYTIFTAAYKRVPIHEDCPLRAVGLHAGVRQKWFHPDVPNDDTFAGYLGGELQLPLRVYAVSEITSRDRDVARHIPYSLGLQWRAAGIAMSMAAIQNGNTSDLSFYYGIGVSHSF